MLNKTDNNIVEYIERAFEIHNKKLFCGREEVFSYSEVIEIAKMIQEQEQFEQMMKLQKKHMERDL